MRFVRREGVFFLGVLLGGAVALGSSEIRAEPARACAPSAVSVTSPAPASSCVAVPCPTEPCIAGPSAGAAPSAPLVAPPDFTFVDSNAERPIRVLSSPDRGRALVYLHGYCGDVNAVGAFVPAARAHGTLIALLGDLPCKGKPGRFKWSGDIRALHRRIQSAVRRVNGALGLRLDPHDITLFGYSQGAARAEALARFYASSYPRLVLGGPPQRPKPRDFTHVRAIAVFGGELEDTGVMQEGTADLQAAGLAARFFLLPGCDHGDFGGPLSGNRSLGAIFDFVSGATVEGPPPSSLPEALRLP